MNSITDEELIKEINKRFNDVKIGEKKIKIEPESDEESDEESSSGEEESDEESEEESDEESEEESEEESDEVSDEESDEEYSNEFYKNKFDEILKNTWNKGKTKTDVEDAKEIFYERYKVYGFYMWDYHDDSSTFYYSSKKPYRNKYNQLCFEGDEDEE